MAKGPLIQVVDCTFITHLKPTMAAGGVFTHAMVAMLCLVAVSNITWHVKADRWLIEVNRTVPQLQARCLNQSWGAVFKWKIN